MIEKEYGKYIGVCDVCGETTPSFGTWEECKYFMKSNEWGAHKNKTTGEWVNLCPECKNL